MGVTSSCSSTPDFTQAYHSCILSGFVYLTVSYFDRANHGLRLSLCFQNKRSYFGIFLHFITLFERNFNYMTFLLNNLFKILVGFPYLERMT